MHVQEEGGLTTAGDGCRWMMVGGVPPWSALYHHTCFKFGGGVHGEHEVTAQSMACDSCRGADSHCSSHRPAAAATDHHRPVFASPSGPMTTSSLTPRSHPQPHHSLNPITPLTPSPPHSLPNPPRASAPTRHLLQRGPERGGVGMQLRQKCGAARLKLRQRLCCRSCQVWGQGGGEDVA